MKHSAPRSQGALIALCTLALSGASGLIYEVGATQILFFYFIKSSYSFATVISVFLGGLGIGSYAIHACASRIQNPRLLFAALQYATAAYAGIIFPRLTYIIADISPLGAFLASAIILIVPTIFLGASLPLAGMLFPEDKQEVIGLLYGVDLLGAIAGALLAGFVLIPVIGISDAILIAAGLNLIASIAVCPPQSKRTFIWIAIALALIGIAIRPSSAVNSQQFATSDFVADFEEHSPFGTIMVKSGELFIDGRRQCGFYWGADHSEDQIGRYALEATMEVKTRTMLNIGLGCGVTLSRMVSDSSVQVDIVEINPVIVQANKKFSNVLLNTRTSLIINDGLKHLRTTTRTYDAIVIDVEDPLIAYSSDLYTLDAFKAAANTLSQSGVLIIWNYEHTTSAQKSDKRYFDILYYTLKEALPYVYQRPDAFIASKKKFNEEEYKPTGPYDINTIDRKILDAAYSNSL